MSVYENFLNYFSMHNKERLDGLSESYFIPMTQQERKMAFKYLLAIVEAGGTEESVNGLFRADRSCAIDSIKQLITSRALNGEAKIAATWNLYKIEKDDGLLPIFIQFMSSSDQRLREKSAYYVPAEVATDELKDALKGMIRTETEQLARIHAVDKILECYRVSEESVGKRAFSDLYKDLHNNNLQVKEAAFKRLDAILG